MPCKKITPFIKLSEEYSKLTFIKGVIFLQFQKE